jgi:ferredoxin--NADP+ reductase
MAYAITQSCCADAACVPACPVNCIHPAPGEPGFGTTDMLYIDPVSCIDCGACADACPVDAPTPADQLTGPLAAYADRNREFYASVSADSPALAGSPVPAGSPVMADASVPAGRSAGLEVAAPVRVPPSLPASVGALRVAVVGTGPAAGYAVRELLRCTDADITVIDRHPVPGGLVRFGVAPDHPATKRIGDSFARSFRHPRVSLRLGVTVGRDISHSDILAHHHAVIYATGTDRPRALGIEGEDLPGSVAALDFLGWANGLPASLPGGIALDTERAVVVGNGNVALDVARLLLSGPDRLSAAPIAPDALAALRSSRVSEVVLLARRGPAEAAFAPKEFLGLRQLPGLSIVVDGDPGTSGEIAYADWNSPAALLRDLPVTDVDWTVPPAGHPRLVLRFHSAPLRALSSVQVDAVQVDAGQADTVQVSTGRADRVPVDTGRVSTVRASDRAAGTLDIPAGLLVRSIGSRAAAIPGLPYDADRGIIPNTGGRVHPGSYVTGWAKRGATGGIGANRACAVETVGALLDDAAAGRLPAPAAGARAFRRLTRSRPARPRAA